MPEQRTVGAAAPSALLAACASAARRAAAFIREQSAQRDQLTWELKSRTDFVSEVDRGAETIIAETLHTSFPGVPIIGEEYTPEASLSGELSFVVDPLDGTTNFLHGYPQYAVSIAAVRSGQPVAGVVLDVERDALYSATAGGGAFENGTALRVSSISSANRALIGTGFPFRDPSDLAHYLPQFVAIAGEASGIRRAGAAALDLADVAAGRLDGFWELQLAPWDIAAGILLVREAGGRATDFSNVELAAARTAVLASNGLLHDWLIRKCAINTRITLSVQHILQDLS